jgi:hypothetical protein
MKKLLIPLALLALISQGCLSRKMVRYTADGKPYSTEKFTAFLVRGEVSKIDEKVKETGKGDYERIVKIGGLKGETETDKVKDLVGAAVEAAVRGASKSVVP